MSKTPETDAMVESSFYSINFPTNPVPAEFARRLERERNMYEQQVTCLLERLGKTQERMIDAECERDGWREAAYSLGEAIPPSWEELQPPAEQLRKFKEMVALQNKKTEKLLDNADKHSKMYP